MRYRKLRIAWSAALFVTCELLIVVWLVSYGDTGGELSRIARIGNVTAEAYQGSIGVMLSHEAFFHPPNLRRMLDSSDAANTSSNIGEFVLWGDFTDGAFICPIWLPVVATLAAAVAPWITWSTRFTIRTLLIVTTIVAMLLGLIVWSIH